MYFSSPPGLVSNHGSLREIALSNNQSAWDREPIEVHRAILDLQDVSEAATPFVGLSSEVDFVALEDSTENTLSLEGRGSSGDNTSALGRVGASVTLGPDGVLYSPQPDFFGLDVVVLVEETGVPHSVYIWVEPQNNAPVIQNENYSFQWFTWELAYIDHEPLEGADYGPTESQRSGSLGSSLQRRRYG